MPVPWLQIVQLVPSILDVSRELLKKTRRVPAADDPPQLSKLQELNGETAAALLSRIAALEENERRQAELVEKMAEQIAVLSRAVTALHRQGTWLIFAAAGAICLGVAALVMASAGQSQ